jgi:hypothetical protein
MGRRLLQYLQIVNLIYNLHASANLNEGGEDDPGILKPASPCAEKFEARNSKSETNPQTRMTKIPNKGNSALIWLVGILRI